MATQRVFRPTGEEIAASLLRVGEDATVERIEIVQRKVGTLHVTPADRSEAIFAAVQAALVAPHIDTRLIHERGRISLAIADPFLRRQEWDVVAAMTLYEGTGCWRVTDVRLCRSRTPLPYFGGGSADDYCATFSPTMSGESEVAKRLLREYREEPDGSLMWCTFDGIVRGAPEVKGYRPPLWAGFDQAGFFSRDEGLAQLKAIKSFWDAYTGDRNEARIDNPLRQPSESEVRFAALMQRPGIGETGTDLSPAP